jgi:four helix bundle protein
MAWHKAVALVTHVYQATQTFPTEERYGLMSQMRRAAVSVPSNIAEGHGRQSPGEFRQFLGQARGSLCELETQIEIAANLAFFSPAKRQELQEDAGEVGRIINGLLASLR